MREETVARSYAATLMALAEKHDAVEAFGNAASLLGEVLGDTPELRQFLETPRIEAAQKKRVIREALGPHVPGPFLTFLLVVFDKRRQRLLGAIGREYQALMDDRAGRIHAEITVARPLDADLRARIEEALAPLLGGTVVSTQRVAPSILGGAVVRSGDRIWDGSLRRRLEGMRRTLLHAGLPEGSASGPAPTE